MQVLISMQAMIFCAEPYYNEPGFERVPNKTASTAYNWDIRGHTVNTAMLPWLRKLAQSSTKAALSPTPVTMVTRGGAASAAAAAATAAVKAYGNHPWSSAKGGEEADAFIWEDVLRNHFSTNCSDIRKRLREWDSNAQHLGWLIKVKELEVALGESGCSSS